MKEWHFYDKVYRRWVVLFVGPFEEVKRELEANGFDDMEWVKDAKGMTVDLLPENNTAGQNATIVWLREWELATLIHEITHLVMMQFDQVGVPISRDNTEAFAFYAEYWFTEMTRARRKFPGGKSIKEAKRG